MKKSTALKIAAALLFSAALIPTAAFTAFAEGDNGGAVVYPDSFEKTLTFERGISDYAVDGNNIAFAAGSDVYFLSDSGDDTTLDYKSFGSIINKIDYFEGSLYIEYISDRVCKYPDNDTTVEHTFQSGRSVSFAESGVYYNLTEQNELYYVVLGQSNDLVGEGFENVKTYDGNVYAVKDNLLYRFNGAAPVAVDMGYTYFEDAKNIKTGDSASLLKTANYTVKTAHIDAGKYYTRIDPDQSGETFKLVPSEKLSTKKSTAKIPCLVLCETGNASIVTIDGECYLVATSSLVEVREYPNLPNGWGDKPAYVVETTSIYSRPYMCESTKIGVIPVGAQNKVTVLAGFTDFSDDVYYKVKFGEGESEVCGFVSSAFLSQYNFSSDNMTDSEKGDGAQNFKYETNVLTVTLTAVIVVLVIVAALYLYLSYCKKSKKRKKEKEERRARDERQNDEEEPDDYEDEDGEEESEEYEDDDRSYESSSYWDDDEG